jgi:hypothetical protein
MPSTTQKHHNTAQCVTRGWHSITFGLGFVGAERHCLTAAIGSIWGKFFKMDQLYHDAAYRCVLPELLQAFLKLHCRLVLHWKFDLDMT